MKLISLPIAFLTSIILARVLSTDDFGQYAFILAAVQLIATPISGGLPGLLTRQVATYATDKAWSLYRGITSFSYLWVTYFCAAVIVACYLFYYFGGGTALTGKWELLPTAILLLPFIGLNAARNGIIKGLGRPAQAELPTQLLQPLFALLGVSLIAWLGVMSKTNALWVQVVAAGLAFIIATLLFVRLSPDQAKSSQPKKETRSWLLSLFPFTLLALVATFNTQIGVIFVGILGTDSAVAAMRVAERGAQFVILPLTLVNFVIAPHIVAAYKTGSQQRLQNLSRKTARGAFVLALPIALVLVIFGQQLLGLAFGEEYREIAYLPLVILVLSQLVSVFFGSVGYLLTMSGFERITLKGQVIAVVVNILSSLILIPDFGAVGAAIAIALAMLTWNILLAIAVIKRLNIRPSAL